MSSSNQSTSTTSPYGSKYSSPSLRRHSLLKMDNIISETVASTSSSPEIKTEDSFGIVDGVNSPRKSPPPQTSEKSNPNNPFERSSFHEKSFKPERSLVHEKSVHEKSQLYEKSISHERSVMHENSHQRKSPIESSQSSSSTGKGLGPEAGRTRSQSHAESEISSARMSNPVPFSMSERIGMFNGRNSESAMDHTSEQNRIAEIRRRRHSVAELRLRFSGSSIPEPNDIFQRKFRMSFRSGAMFNGNWNIRTIDSPKKKELLQSWSNALHKNFGETVTIEAAEEFLASQGVTPHEVGDEAWDEWQDALKEVVSNSNTPEFRNRKVMSSFSDEDQFDEYGESEFVFTPEIIERTSSKSVDSGLSPKSRNSLPTYLSQKANPDTEKKAETNFTNAVIDRSHSSKVSASPFISMSKNAKPLQVTPLRSTIPSPINKVSPSMKISPTKPKDEEPKFQGNLSKINEHEDTVASSKLPVSQHSNQTKVVSPKVIASDKDVEVVVTPVQSNTVTPKEEDKISGRASLDVHNKEIKPNIDKSSSSSSPCSNMETQPSPDSENVITASSEVSVPQHRASLGTTAESNRSVSTYPDDVPIYSTNSDPPVKKPSIFCCCFSSKKSQRKQSIELSTPTKNVLQKTRSDNGSS